MIEEGIAAGEIALTNEDITEVRVERPKVREHGDWSTNVAMQYAKKAGMNPRAFAELVVARLATVEGIESAEIAGPGFINIRLAAGAAGELARAIVEAGADFGRGVSSRGGSQ